MAEVDPEGVAVGAGYDWLTLYHVTGVHTGVFFGMHCGHVTEAIMHWDRRRNQNHMKKRFGKKNPNCFQTLCQIFFQFFFRSKLTARQPFCIDSRRFSKLNQRLLSMYP